jgi:hypothetical protein
MMGEVLKRDGVARLVGVDIVPEARDAAYRDRPTVYDAYCVEDLGNLDPNLRDELNAWNFDCLTCVAVAALDCGDSSAPGFEYIPPGAFFNAIRFIRPGGWLAFNINHSFLETSEQSGFARLVRALIFSKYLDIYHLELYRHRLSMEGTQLFYYALVGRLTAPLPEDFLEVHDIAH